MSREQCVQLVVGTMCQQGAGVGMASNSAILEHTASAAATEEEHCQGYHHRAGKSAGSTPPAGSGSRR